MLIIPIECLKKRKQIFRTFPFYYTSCCYLFYLSPGSSADIFVFVEDICDPDYDTLFLLSINSTSRSICSKLCEELFDDSCNGFFFHRKKVSANTLSKFQYIPKLLKSKFIFSFLTILSTKNLVNFLCHHKTSLLLMLNKQYILVNEHSIFSRSGMDIQSKLFYIGVKRFAFVCKWSCHVQFDVTKLIRQLYRNYMYDFKDTHFPCIFHLCFRICVQSKSTLDTTVILKPVIAEK